MRRSATIAKAWTSFRKSPRIDGDLKNVQRPWAVKAVLANVPPPARLLEIGGGEPIVSGFLSELGYDVTLVDPYDGFGNGPTDYQALRRAFSARENRAGIFSPRAERAGGRIVRRDLFHFGAGAPSRATPSRHASTPWRNSSRPTAFPFIASISFSKEGATPTILPIPSESSRSTKDHGSRPRRSRSRIWWSG